MPQAAAGSVDIDLRWIITAARSGPEDSSVDGIFAPPGTLVHVAAAKLAFNS